ncbi:hypothetical protein [Neotabrizicola sp. sgz301269]|uniref:hypothetical protein n=1 Tax=Neotabrizicola sp. sgz301269 TaxID=3276282 RepID=UPI0037703C26
MKPNFALNLSDTGIALLHRTAKGWALVGETPFDAPDLAEALDYLRKTALDLEPGGISTKLVIPNSQILYAEIAAPGPSEQERRDQILAELEGRTPYKGDEIAFDFSGRGKVVKVAAVARETLAEAEAFAAEHRFNPVSFVAMPEGNYSGEPWFGPTGAAKAMLAAGEIVERDRNAITLPPSTLSPAAPPPSIDKDEKPKDAPPAAGETGQAEEHDRTTVEKAHGDSADMAGAPVKGPAKAPPMATPPQPAVPSEPATLDMAMAKAADLAKNPEKGSTAGAPAAAEQTQPATPAGPASPVPPMAAALRDEPTPVPPPPPLGASRGLPTAGAATADPKADPGLAEEAPFTHVADASVPGLDDDIPPMPAGAAARIAALSGRPTGIAAPSLPDERDDLPPAPSAAAMAVLANRRAGGEPSGAADTSARPDAAALARAARGKPVEDLPPMPRPTPAGSAAAAGAAAGVSGLAGLKSAPAAPAAVRGGLGALVKGQAIAGARKSKQKPAPVAARSPVAPTGGAAAAAPVAAASDAARSLSRSPFASPPRGKPRHLALILTVILLLCLALVAAWSSLYLAATEDQDTAVIASAPEATDEADIPAIEDEMLADSQDPDALEAQPVDEAALAPDADPAMPADAANPAEEDALALSASDGAAPAAEPADETALAPEGTAEAAPDTGLAADAPAAVALNDGQDEIFLATSEAPPPAFDALSLPNPDPAVDSMPAPPMPPPPPGTVYRFDANGLIVPTPDGIPSPAGFMIFAGKPDRVPPVRSAVAEEAAAKAAEALAAEAAAAALPPADAAAPAAAALPAGPEAQPDPELADRRPRARPAELAPATAEDDAALSDDLAPQFASLRPRERPPTVLAAGERARAETAGASLASPEGTAVVEPAAMAASDSGNPALLAISRRPAEKPRDFSRAVEAAVAAAVRAPLPEAAPEPEQTAAAAPSGKAKPDEQAEIDEPEVAASVAPKIPTKASVAKQATFKNAINLKKTNLIGVYGTQSKRYALIRQSNGRYKKVKVGDRIDGGTIQAITQTELRYQKGGRLMVLAMPKG